MGAVKERRSSIFQMNRWRGLRSDRGSRHYGLQLFLMRDAEIKYSGRDVPRLTRNNSGEAAYFPLSWVENPYERRYQDTTLF